VTSGDAEADRVKEDRKAIREATREAKQRAIEEAEYIV
jgi:hypothetical protein